MRELSLNEIGLVSGGADANACKNDVLAAGAFGATIGSAFGFIGTGLGALGFGALAAEYSPNCQAGDDYNTPSKK